LGRIFESNLTHKRPAASGFVAATTTKTLAFVSRANAITNLDTKVSKVRMDTAVRMLIIRRTDVRGFAPQVTYHLVIQINLLRKFYNKELPETLQLASRD
jgi:hypothetical protein